MFVPKPSYLYTLSSWNISSGSTQVKLNCGSARLMFSPVYSRGITCKVISISSYGSSCLLISIVTAFFSWNSLASASSSSLRFFASSSSASFFYFSFSSYSGVISGSLFHQSQKVYQILAIPRRRLGFLFFLWFLLLVLVGGEGIGGIGSSIISQLSFISAKSSSSCTFFYCSLITASM